MTKISATIITFNEERNIERCLQSLQGVADEIIVVDSFSTDRTCEVVKKMGGRCVQHVFEGYIEQKNFALSEAEHDFVLSLDADEVLSGTLKESILKEKAAGFPFSGYKMNRLTFIGDQPVQCCGWYPDRKMRLFDRSKGSWAGFNPHDEFRFHGSETGKQLDGNLLHYSFASVAALRLQTRKFAEISAEAYANRNKKIAPLASVLSPAFRFVRDYFFKNGFLCGKLGFSVAYYNALGTRIKYKQLKKIKKSRNQARNK